MSNPVLGPAPCVLIQSLRSSQVAYKPLCQACKQLQAWQNRFQPAARSLGSVAGLMQVSSQHSKGMSPLSERILSIGALLGLHAISLPLFLSSLVRPGPATG